MMTTYILKDFPRNGRKIEVISIGDVVYVPVAFNEPNASLVLVDNEGNTYASPKHPMEHRLGFRCFNLDKPIPKGRQFHGTITVEANSYEVKGEAVNALPAFASFDATGTRGVEKSSRKTTLWYVLGLIVVVVALAVIFGRGGSTEAKSPEEPVINVEDGSQDGIEQPTTPTEENITDKKDGLKKEEPAVIDFTKITVVEQPSKGDKQESKPEVKQQSENKPEVKSTPKPEVKPAPTPQPKKPESTQPPKPEPSQPPKPVPSPQPEPEPTPQPKPVPTPQPKPVSTSPSEVYRPSDYQSLDEVPETRSNGIYVISNESDVKALGKIGNCGSENVVLLFCPDRFSSNMTQRQYNKLWSNMVQNIHSQNIREIQVLKPVKKGLKLPADRQLNDVRNRNISVNIQEQ